jgi:hypothetical protein
MVRWLECSHFFVGLLHKCDGSCYVLVYYLWSSRRIWCNSAVSTLLPTHCTSGYVTSLHNSTKKCLHFKYRTLFTPRWLCIKVANLFYAALLWFDSLMVVNCGSKHAWIFSAILWHKLLRNKFVNFVGLVPWFNSYVVLVYTMIDNIKCFSFIFE